VEGDQGGTRALLLWRRQCARSGRGLALSCEKKTGGEIQDDDLDMNCLRAEASGGTGGVHVQCSLNQLRDSKKGGEGKKKQ